MSALSDADLVALADPLGEIKGTRAVNFSSKQILGD
jgi:hypothetical protein